MLPRCTTEAMTLHLAEIAQAVTPGSHAVYVSKPEVVAALIEQAATAK